MNAQIATPSVSYSYDPNYNRMLTMTDGTGVTAYSYNPITSTPAPGAGQLATVDGPLTDDTIAYGYDELGRATAQSINGAANASSVQFDALGRPTATTNAFGTFAFFHVNATGRLDHVDLPNGEKTQIAYFDNLGDQRLRQIKHLGPGSALISQFDYTYDPGGQIKTWTQANPGAANSKRYDFGYDGADQLRSAHLVDTGNGNAIQQSGYDYDSAGNRTNEQAGAAVATAVPNSLNQITSRAGGGKMHFRGTVNEPATVRVGGNNASVDAAGNFDGLAEVNVGNNTVPVLAIDANGNSRTNNYEVTVSSGGSATLTYDLNGNLANDGSKTYEWDAANRLVAINYIGATDRTELSYDGLSHRQKIVEKSGGAVTSTKQFVWVGDWIAEEREGSNVVTRRYFGQGEQRLGGADAGVYYYTRDHLGSIRELTDSSATLRARYEYDPFGNTSKLSGDLDVDFGYTGHYRHARSNLHLAPYRAYDSTTGRWLSRDPIGEAGGLNLYGYVENDPINYVDPDGRNPVAGALIGLGLGGPVGAVIGAGIGTGVVIIGGAAIIDWWRNRPSPPPQTDTQCPVKPPFQGEPGSTAEGTKQTRRYGPDGYPDTDVDSGHDHGAGDPHAHDWGRPSGGGPPTHKDRSPGRPPIPGDPPPAG